MLGSRLYRSWPRFWRGPPLVLQILILLFGGLIVAQVATLVLTVLLPPRPAPQHSLEAIAAALRGQAMEGGDRLDQSFQSGPPNLAGPGWLASDRSRRDLAALLDADLGDVRLAFYTPLPFAGTVAPPPPNGAAVQQMAYTVNSVRFEAPGFRLAGFRLIAEAGPGGGGPGPGGPGGNGFSGAGLSDRGNRSGLPGADFSRGDASQSQDRAGSSPDIDRRPRPSGAAAPATEPRAPAQNAAPPTTRPADAVGRANARPDSRSGQGFGRAQPLLDSGWRVTLPAAVELGSEGATDPAQAAEPEPTPAPAAAASHRTVPPPAAHALPPVTAPDARPAAAPRPLPRAEDRPRAAHDQVVPLPAPALGLFGLAPAPFVEGDFVAALRLADGRWTVVRPAVEPFPNTWQRRVLLWFLVSFVLVAPLGWLFARRIVKPLSSFATAAEQLGRDPSALVLQLDGPAEVGRAAHAFNLMQSRLKSFVDDRTAMVGAISHDLRTPLTRLRFRLEDVDDDAIRDGMIGEVVEMEEMITSVLAFIRDASVPGVRERLDFRAIIEDVAGEAKMVGGDVEIETSEAAQVEVDVLGMRRLLGNLVDNAVKYGARARIRLVVDADEAYAEIRDDGPGLPEHELERAFEPFYRSEHARNSDKRGSGLGLAVCRSIARAHGGDVRLLHSKDGFVAQLRVPLIFGAARPIAA